MKYQKSITLSITLFDIENYFRRTRPFVKGAHYIH